MEQILDRKKNLNGEDTEEAIDYQVQKRSKRSVSSPRHVEALGELHRNIIVYSIWKTVYFTFSL